MNILIVTQYFHPENFRINDFAIEFSKRGHNVTVLTGTPNYPGGKFFDGYGIFKNNYEEYNGIKIYRIPLIPRGSGSSARLAINYISYVISGFFASGLVSKNSADIIFVFEPSPITVALPAILIKKIKKIPICLWVLDLWPESVISAGNIKTSVIPNLLNPIVKFIYNKSDKILVSSQGFIKSIVEKGINEKKISFYPQWAEEVFQPINVKKYSLNKIPEKSFKIMFAGNIGEAQDFKSIIDTAKLLKDYKNIHWIILGGGRKEAWVKSQIHEHKLENNFHMLGKFPLEKMPEFYAQADCMLFSLKKEYIFSITIPAKVQSYLACAKPILAMIDGEASSIINDSKAGLSCPSESPELLAKNIKKLSKMSKVELDKLGKNALDCYKKYFERNMLMDKAESIFSEMIKRSF